MGSFSRSFRALLWRNAIYRKRKPISALIEFVLPMITVSLIFLLKNAVENSAIFNQPQKENIPSDEQTIIPLSFTDYVTSLQAQRTCGSYGNFFRGSYITGITPDWVVPFVQCDATRCDRAEQDAAKFCEYRILALAPRNNFTEQFRDWIYLKNPILGMNETELMENNITLNFNHSFIQIFDTTEEIDTYVQSMNYGFSEKPKIGAAIIIEKGNPDYTYSIRVNSTNFNTPINGVRPAAVTTPPTNTKFEDYAKDADYVCKESAAGALQGPWQLLCTGQYMYNGFITLQRLVGDWIIYDSGAEELGNKVAENGVSFVTFPREEYVRNDFFTTVSTILPLIIVLGLMYPIGSMIRMIVSEKELRQKELLKMMSVTDFTIEASWFVSFFVFFVPCAFGVAMVSHMVYSNSEFLVLLVFWELLFLALIFYCMAISSYFSSSSRAALLGQMMFFFGYFGSMRTDFNTASLYQIVTASFHPVCALTFALQVLGDLEDDGVGATFENLFYSNSPSGYSIGLCIQTLAYSCVFSFVISWYVNRVMPGSYGRSRPLYFPFTRTYWLGGKNMMPLEKHNENIVKNDENEASVLREPVSETLKQQARDGMSIELLNLSKTYGKKTAVSDLTFSMYSGQVTALLGENGAGKTTTINMLTGMVAPTSGNAIIAGKDVQTQIDEVRQNLGVCLQHDCLFPSLTVLEHIQFFAQIKGLYETKLKNDAERSILSSIEDVALSDKRNTYSKNLSGGMKRKLSMAIAFCGDSKVVFLDEPTSGMDPFSRRFTWNLIREYRPNRCIILTTHFMDEADLLGDRIAIMAQGCLRCIGSSLFLKQKYGVGYRLTIEKNPATRRNTIEKLQDFTEAPPIDNDDENLNEPEPDVETSLKELVMNSITDSKLLTNVGTEMCFQLPLENSHQFTGVLKSLDEYVASDNIVTYGVSITTLDEVFLSIARGSDIDSSSFNREDSTSDIAGPDVTIAKDDIYKRLLDRVAEGRSIIDMKKFYRTSPHALEGQGVFQRHTRALLRKRALNFKRDKKAWFCSVLMPTLVTMFGFLSFMYAGHLEGMEPLVLTFDDFNPSLEGELDRNPIAYNSADEFQCFNGECLISGYSRNTFKINTNSEHYFMCGYLGSLEGYQGSDGKEKCSPAGNAKDILDQVNKDGVYLNADENSTTIYEAALHRLEEAHAFKATQYGALYFTRNSSSMYMNNRNTMVSWNQTVVERCMIYPGNYRTKEQCMNFGGISYVVMTNFTSIHAPLIYQTLADEAIVNDVVDQQITINATAHPLPPTVLEQSFREAESGMIAWFLIIFAFPFITSSFAIFIVQEKQSNAKHLQTVAGVKPAAYWVSSFVWDLVNYQIPLVLIIMMMYVMDITIFISPERSANSGTLITLILFGPAAAGFTYIVTFLFKSPSKANFILISSNFLVGLAGPLVVYILRLLTLTGDRLDPTGTIIGDFNRTATIVEWILRPIPCFNLGKALFFLVNVNSIEALTGFGFQKIDVWSPEILRHEVICLAVEAILYPILVIYLDKWSSDPKLQKKWEKFVYTATCLGIRNKIKRRNQNPPLIKSIDEDVTNEKNRVMSGEADMELIVIKDLSKKYRNDLLAVDSLSLGIPAGECFGLLGINGAGKTTTMKMLTAEFSPTKGDAFMGGYSVTLQPSATRRRIGYCPQFNAHFANMTGREHIELYASIRGIPSEDIKDAACVKLLQVGLNDEDGNKLSSNYSGGMQRKLSVACALIGEPEVIFLDEPSTGMDPVSRRELWRVISNIVGYVNEKEGKLRTSVILTTHSMEECEALCQRIGIMACGRLKCLGSAQRLKHRFGKGYQVELKVTEADREDGDYKSVVFELLQFLQVKDISENMPHESLISNAENTMVKLDTAKAAIQAITMDETITARVTDLDPVGGLIYKNATTDGVTADELGIFCANELRIVKISNFIYDKYEDAVLRERQDHKLRMEISKEEGLRVSDLFELIETNKENLKLSDYGISQTSLEQVFNMHAAEAETEKRHQFGNNVNEIS